MSHDYYDFRHEYALETLQVIRPTGHSFEMEVTPRYLYHYVDNTYEAFTSRLFANLLFSRTLFVDIGAHYGFYTLLAATQHRDLKVLAIEPIPENHYILRRNVERHDLKNVQTRCIAASDRDGQARINITAASDHCSFYNHPDSELIRTIEVETITVDSLLAEHAPQPTLIKIDTEGHELRVLAGMRNTLARFPDLAFIIECNSKCLRSAGQSAEILLATLAELGFETYFLDDLKQQALKAAYEYDRQRLIDDNRHTYINLYCPRRERSLSVCFVSHLGDMIGSGHVLLELVREITRNYSAVCTVIVPEHGTLIPHLEEAGAAWIVAPLHWWLHVTPMSRDEGRERLAHSIQAMVDGPLQSIQSVNPDFIVTITLALPWGAVAAELLGKPHIWYVCEFGEDQYGIHFFFPWQDVLEFVRRSSAFIFTLNEEQRKLLFPSGDNTKCLPLYPVVNLPTRKADVPKHQYYTRSHATRVGVFGTLCEGKGQHEAIKALAHLVEQGHDVELLLAGYELPGYREHLERLIQEYGIAAYVRMPGFISDVFLVMEETDIILICSRHEAFGLVAVEALLLGKPVVYPASGGFLDYMIDGKTGLAYPPGQVDELTTRLKDLLADPELGHLLGENGRIHARQRFTPETYGGTFVHILRQLRQPEPSADYLVSQLRTMAVHSLSGMDQVKALQQELHAIKTTFGWQILLRYWRLVHHLLPPETRRRRIFDGLISAVTSWRTSRRDPPDRKRG